MVTPHEMRLFGRDCLRWADESSNPSDRDIICRAARMWTSTAAPIEQQLREGYALASPDLRRKLD